MRDPLLHFDWSSLYERYDAMCRRFDPATVHLKAVAPRPESDRKLYYRLVDAIHTTSNQRQGLSIDLYEPLLYWKLYSNPQALGNVRRWLGSIARVSAAANLEHLLDGLPSQLERDVGRVVSLVKQLGMYNVVGMKTATALPMRTTFLHFLFPDVVPIFDKMVLQAVGVQEWGANHSIDVLREYLPFAWELADRHAARLPDHYRETSVRLVDMALWVVRGEGTGEKPRTSRHTGFRITGRFSAPAPSAAQRQRLDAYLWTDGRK